jgi:hypothetical protein
MAAKEASASGDDDSAAGKNVHGPLFLCAPMFAAVGLLDRWTGRSYFTCTFVYILE